MASASAFSRIFAFRYFRRERRFFGLVRTAAEYDNPVAGKQVGNVPLDKSLHGNEFRSPAIHVDDPGIPIFVVADNILALPSR